MAFSVPALEPEATALLRELHARVQGILEGQFVAMYLDGSLTSGDFDQDSDIDFVVVTADEIPEAIFQALQAMHDRLATLATPWAIQLEGSYLSRRALRRYDPAFTRYPNLERGLGERLKWVHHTETWDVHRFVLRDRGIVLSGPPLAALIDPVTPAQLRQAMRVLLSGWATHLLEHPALFPKRGYQTYIVLTLCRILYTLENGTVVSKPTAARWAQAWLGAPWNDLIERTWEGRHNSDQNAAMEDVAGTLEMIRLVLTKTEL